MRFEIGFGEALNGDQKALSLPLMPTPNFGDHCAVIVADDAEELHPINRSLSDLQALPIQPRGIREV